MHSLLSPLSSSKIITITFQQQQRMITPKNLLFYLIFPMKLWAYLSLSFNASLCTIMSFFKIGQNSNNGTKSYLHMYVQIPENLTRLRLILYEQWPFSYRRSAGANLGICSILVLKSPLFLNFRAKNQT